MNKEQIINELCKLDVISKDKVIEYVNFCIKKNKSKHIKSVTELHHILPKAKTLPFTAYSNLLKNKWNGVYLSYEDHYIAHSILCDAINNQPITYAWWMMNSLNSLNPNGQIIIGKDKYTELRLRHLEILSNEQTKRNKNTNIIENRHRTMLKKDKDGLNGYQRQGKKISESLRKNKSQVGQRNSMAGKIIIKERLNPTNTLGVNKNPDISKYVPHQIKYIQMFDNKGKLYCEGWKDECQDFCENIGLDSKLINYTKQNIFTYTGAQNVYVRKLMNKLGLSRYINTTIKVLSDADVAKKFNKK